MKGLGPREKEAREETGKEEGREREEEGSGHPSS